MTTATNVMELECSQCGKKYDAGIEQHLCTCGRPLLVRYDLKHAAATPTLDEVLDVPGSVPVVRSEVVARRRLHRRRDLDRVDVARLDLRLHEEVEDAVDAVRVLPEFRPEVILLDLRMPLLDGEAFLRGMSGLPASREVPVVRSAC